MIADHIKPKTESDIPMPLKPPRYAWDMGEMNVGDSRVVPVVDRRRAQAACWHEHKKTGKSFVGETRMEDGFEVYRFWRKT